MRKWPLSPHCSFHEFFSPVVSAIQSTVANQGHGMATKCLVGGFLVHARLVGWKIIVDSEGHIHWTIVHQLLHDVLDTTDTVSLGCMELISLEVSGIPGFRALGALPGVGILT